MGTEKIERAKTLQEEALRDKRAIDLRRRLVQGLGNTPEWLQALHKARFADPIGKSIFDPLGFTTDAGRYNVTLDRRGNSQISSGSYSETLTVSRKREDKKVSFSIRLDINERVDDGSYSYSDPDSISAEPGSVECRDAIVTNFPEFFNDSSSDAPPQENPEQ